VATSVVVFRHSSLGYTVHVKLVSARTMETGEIIRGDTFMFSTVARYISTASCFLATEMIPPLGFFCVFRFFGLLAVSGMRAWNSTEIWQMMTACVLRPKLVEDVSLWQVELNVGSSTDVQVALFRCRSNE
jgi:hypothetical protein